jgi:hypothetical protein
MLKNYKKTLENNALVVVLHNIFALLVLYFVRNLSFPLEKKIGFSRFSYTLCGTFFADKKGTSA